MVTLLSIQCLFEYELRNVVEYFQLVVPIPSLTQLIFTNSFITGTLHGTQFQALISSLEVMMHMAVMQIFGSYSTVVMGRTNSGIIPLLFQLGFTSDGTFGIDTGQWSSSFSLPFPDSWSMDENGIHVDEDGMKLNGHFTRPTCTSFHTGTTLSNG